MIQCYHEDYVLTERIRRVNREIGDHSPKVGPQRHRKSSSLSHESALLHARSIFDLSGLVAQEQGLTIAYARVSGVAQKPDLANQVKALEAYCHQHSIKVDAWMQDIGSGLNYIRKQFNRLMEMVELGQVRRLVLAHTDWLVRFGYGYFEAFCQRHHTELVVMDGETLSPEQELVQDLVAILTVFSARLHGLRSYKKVIKDAALQKDQAQRD